jgi:hypothetical protein
MNDINSTLHKLMRRVIEHLPEEGDLSLVILKGHLILEEELNRVVEAQFKHPEYIQKGNFRFSQLVRIAKAIYFSQDKSWLWGAINKLNDVRNDYAHSLEPEEVETKILEFIHLIESKLGSCDENIGERLRRSIALTITVLHDYRVR